MEALSTTFSDLTGSITRWRLWTMLAWEDIQQRYRGSFLGPAWMTIGMAVTSAGLAFLFGALFHQPWTETVAYISAGIMVWTFITSSLNEGCYAILSASNIIRNVNVPLSVHVWRVLLRNILIMLHSVPVVVIFLIIAKTPLSPIMLLMIPGLLILCVWLWAAIFALGILAARFRDIPQLVTYVLQFAMFVTPIFWHATQMGSKRAHIIVLNPLAHLLGIVRDPLLSVAPSANTWLAAGGVTLATVAFSVAIVATYRKQVALWI